MPKIERWSRVKRTRHETLWEHDIRPLRVVVSRWEGDDWLADAEVAIDTRDGKKVPLPESGHRVDITTGGSRREVEDKARSWMKSNPQGGMLEDRMGGPFDIGTVIETPDGGAYEVVDVVGLTDHDRDFKYRVAVEDKGKQESDTRVMTEDDLFEIANQEDAEVW